VINCYIPIFTHIDTRSDFVVAKLLKAGVQEIRTYGPESLDVQACTGFKSELQIGLYEGDMTSFPTFDLEWLVLIKAKH